MDNITKLKQDIKSLKHVTGLGKVLAHNLQAKDANDCLRYYSDAHAAKFCTLQDIGSHKFYIGNRYAGDYGSLDFSVFSEEELATIITIIETAVERQAARLDALQNKYKAIETLLASDG